LTGHSCAIPLANGTSATIVLTLTAPATAANATISRSMLLLLGVVLAVVALVVLRR
jgi:hypothetical protein